MIVTTSVAIQFIEKKRYSGRMKKPIPRKKSIPDNSVAKISAHKLIQKKVLHQGTLNWNGRSCEINSVLPVWSIKRISTIN